MKIKNWMLTSLIGILAIIFGLIALFFPSITLVALAIYFSISILIGGIALTIGSFKVKNQNYNWRFLLFEGILAIFLGSIILLNPEVSVTVFITIIGVWAIFLGIIFLSAYFRAVIPTYYRSFLSITGVVSLLFGILAIINPFESSRVIAVLIGIYAVAYGILSIINNTKTNR